MKRRIIRALLLVLPTALILGVHADAQPAKSGGTLRVAWEQDVTGFDPHWTSGLQVTYIAGNLCNNLVGEAVRVGAWRPAMGISGKGSDSMI